MGSHSPFTDKDYSAQEVIRVLAGGRAHTAGQGPRLGATWVLSNFLCYMFQEQTLEFYPKSSLIQSSKYLYPDWRTTLNNSDQSLSDRQPGTHPALKDWPGHTLAPRTLLQSSLASPCALARGGGDDIMNGGVMKGAPRSPVTSALSHFQVWC